MILIDSREQFKEEIQAKLQSLHINAQIMKLENYADYVLTSDNKEVQNAVAIQRKTIGEVLSQFKDIQTRLSELQKYGVPYLLIEENGLFINSGGMILSKRGKLLYETGIKAQSYYNFLHSIQRTGTYIQKTHNWEHSIWWLHALHKYIQKEHYPRLDRTYTNEEEIVGALQSIPKVGITKAQQIYGAYEILNVSNALNMIVNTSTQNTLTLKVFDMLLTRVKYVLKGHRLSKNVLMKQLKTRIIKNESLLNAFISVLIEEGYLQKEQKGKYVYYYLPHKKKERKKQNNFVDDDNDKWLEEADALTEQME